MHESVPASPKGSLRSVIRNWLRPRLAQITELRLVRDTPGGEKAGEPPTARTPHRTG